MISVEEALAKILCYVDVLEPERKPILDCLGQVLAQDIYSTIDIPPLDNSAMDGFALRAEDTLGATDSSPRYLTVVGEITAGSMPTQEVGPGTAIRIMTGAPIPAGADAVVQFENTDEVSRKSSGRDVSQIGILCHVRKGLNVRRRGEDIAKGKLILQQGMVLRPQEIGMLASLGLSTSMVIRRPIVSILATGDELTPVDQPLAPGKIHDSNTYTIAAEVSRYGGVPRILGIGRDSVQSLNEKIAEGLDADMLITSGGVSKGDYDVVKDVLAEHGQIGFWSVRMKPGKPLAFGVINTKDRQDRRMPHLGLPGNPVSSMITFEQFARPAILKMLGKKVLAKPTIRAIIDGDITNTDGRRVFARVTVTKHGGQYHACLAGPQGSGILTSMARANGLAVVPEDSKGVIAGDMVEVQMLDWTEEQDDARMPPLVAIVGRSESGKTLLVEQLIGEFKRRGYRIATLKHSHCGDIEVDQPGKDTWKFAQAGSEAVCISSPRKLALIKKSDHDLRIGEVLPTIGPGFDLVLVEGFKKSNLPKIEVHRKDLGNDLLCSPEDLSAIVTDGPLDAPLVDSYKVPILSWADTPVIADFIERNFVLKGQSNAS